jgi:hypothetical protein
VRANERTLDAIRRPLLPDTQVGTGLDAHVENTSVEGA